MPNRLILLLAFVLVDPPPSPLLVPVNPPAPTPTPEDARLFKSGSILTFTPSHHLIVAPAFTDSNDYRTFVATASKSPMGSLTRSFASFVGMRADARLKVERVIAANQFGVAVTTIQGTLLSGSKAGQTAWVPAAYFRPGAPPRDATGELPVFALARNPTHAPKVGENLYARNDDGNNIFSQIDMFAHQDKLKFLRAGDKKGISDMLRGRRILLLRPLTKVLVAEVHDNEFINNGELVVECRVLEGEHDGKLLWIAAHEIAEYTVAVFDPQKDFDALADKAFRIADAIERSGRKGTAFKRYREIVTLYDGTDGAFKARARMKKLDPSPPTPSEKAATEKAASNAFRAAKALESGVTNFSGGDSSDLAN